MTHVFHSVLRLARLVAGRFVEDRCVQVAGSLTFTTLLALVPLLAIAVTLIAAFPVFEDWSNEIKVFILLNFVPEAGGRIITGYMQQFAQNATRLTALGILFLGTTALMLVITIERVFNVIWRVRRERPLLHRLVVYWAALTVGPLLIGASLSLTSWLVGQSLGIARAVPGGDSILLGVVPLLLSALAFGLLYLTLPNRRVRTADALVGGFTAALAFEFMKRGFALYVAAVPAYDAVYGTFATIPIFLLWIFLCWSVVLLGAVVVAILPHWRLGSPGDEHSPGRRFHLAWRILRAMHAAKRTGIPASTAGLAGAAVLSEEDAEDLLGRLEALGWVSRLGAVGWALLRDLDSLTVADLFRAFVFRAGAHRTGDSTIDAEADALEREIMTRIEPGLDRPLDTVFREEAALTEDGSDAGPAPAKSEDHRG